MNDLQQFVDTCGAGRLVWMLRNLEERMLASASRETDALLAAQLRATSASYEDVAVFAEAVLSGRAAELD